ncbi:MAG: nickel pincer cofactor biosynthesis protein LarB [Bryobacteraceae bacterium]|nr:nickel pincer cofactor biosynthesis protein LarB [Bryobacteraceae bacterium]
MTPDKLRELLEDVRTGGVEVDAAVNRLKGMPFENLGYAVLDHHRAIRHGMPEVIYGEGKAPAHLLGIFKRLRDHAPNVLATRVAPEAAELVLAEVPEAEYYPVSRVLRAFTDREIRSKGKMAIVCAGTADLPVAEEARLVAETMGNEILAISDVGVAGIHRLFGHLDQIREARVCLAVAGMEAALPSVLGGLVSCPVIGVPTSVGYGAHFHGLASLLGMLNSCASNVTVVNIDNGFGAAYVATLINRI